MRRSSRIRTLLGAATICAAPFLFGPREAISQVLPFHNYTTRDGLPSNHITSLCQDSEGFIWIGTDEGLCVYDGASMRTYTTVDGLANNYITSVIESRRSPGTMGVASISGGIVRYGDGKFTTLGFGRRP